MSQIILYWALVNIDIKMQNCINRQIDALLGVGDNKIKKNG